jgi:hypothetical protein
MQGALDSAALMLAREDASGSLTAAQVTQKAQDYFNALYTNRYAKNVAVSATFSTGSSLGSTIQLTGSGTVTTDFMKMVGTPSMSFGITSTAAWGTTKLRVALVLDNTYSMNDANKMPSLKSSAKSLIDTLSSSAKNPGDVLISIVPFNVDVNIGKSNSSQAWLDWSDWDANNGKCSNTNYTTQSSCTAANKTWTPNRSTWTGCVQDRSTITNIDTLSTAPTMANSLTLFSPVREDFYYGYFGDPCPQQITPLSYDWTTLKNSIDAMTPNGTTNQAIGMMWGWFSLLQQPPLSAPVEDPNFIYQKVIVLLSDGDNTANRTYPWDGTGNYPSQTTINAIDARQKLLCDNVKAAGVTIYAIQVNTDGTAKSSVMSYCASGSGNYFSTTSASGISTAFTSIGTSLSKLRIAR